MSNFQYSISTKYRISMLDSQENNGQMRIFFLYHDKMEKKLWVKTARTHAGLTQDQLGDLLGVTKGNVSAWENGRHDPGFAQMLKINEITKYPLPIDPSHFNAGESQVIHQHGKWAAIVGTAQGGPDGYISIDDYVAGDGDAFIYTYSTDENAYELRIRGDSMKPRIKSGEFIVAEPNHEALPGDDVVVMRHDGRSLVKELLWIRDGEVSLGSINNGIPAITMPISDIKSIHRVSAIVPRGSAMLKKREDN